MNFFPENKGSMFWNVKNLRKKQTKKIFKKQTNKHPNQVASHTYYIRMPGDGS